MAVEVSVCQNEAEVVSKLCKHIETKANECLKRNGVFRVGLSGGSLIKFLVKGLPGIKTSWAQWRLFFCDERLVPFSHDDSTYGAYERNLIPCVPLNPDQFVKVDISLKAPEAARKYASQLECEFDLSPPSLPRFDLLLLGFGEDGHTCSLFPGHPLLKEEKLWVAGIQDSPKPPPCRVTLTMPVLNNAKAVVFVTLGEGKAEAIKDVLEGGGKTPVLPAAMVSPTDGELRWIVDKEAAKLLL